jgi:hypothetical protein
MLADAKPYLRKGEGVKGTDPAVYPPYHTGAMDAKGKRGRHLGSGARRSTLGQALCSCQGMPAVEG